MEHNSNLSREVFRSFSPSENGIFHGQIWGLNIKFRDAIQWAYDQQYVGMMGYNLDTS
jgi:hypothetical protein